MGLIEDTKMLKKPGKRKRVSKETQVAELVDGKKLVDTEKIK